MFLFSRSDDHKKTQYYKFLIDYFGTQLGVMLVGMGGNNGR
jgi:hypothetical protein